MKHHGNNGPGRAKPPYDGYGAGLMGWPCVPPYQMKRRIKEQWRKDWYEGSWAKDQRYQRKQRETSDVGNLVFDAQAIVDAAR